MKKIFTFMLCVLVSMGAVAQVHGGRSRSHIVVHSRPSRPAVTVYDYCRPWHNTYYGFRLGLNAGSVRSDSPVLNGSEMKTGLNIGFAVGTQLSRYTPLFIESGLYYSQKGGKSSNGLDYGKFTYDLNYLELPILLKYKHFTRSGVSIEPFAGAFVSCGVAGNIKDYAERQAFSSFSDGYFNRLDGGIKLGCGVGYDMGYAEVAYDIGLANVGQDTFDDTHTGCLTINIGVNF